MKRQQNRRDFLKTASASGIGLSQLSLLHAAEKKKRPNILFIITDQQHSGMMSCTGNPYLKTPAMDRLAASGKRFEMAYSANPVCVPARFSFFTGRMPSAMGMGENLDGKKGAPKEMAEQAMGWLLQKAGYETVYGGKVHLPKGLALDQIGFTNITSDQRAELADKCVEYLKQPHDKPFLLVASFINPHDICYMAIDAHGRFAGLKPRNNDAAKVMAALITEPKKDLKQFVKDHCPPLPENFDVPDLEPEGITESYLKVREFRQYVRDNWSDEMWRLHRWAYCRLTEMVDEKIGKVLDAVRDAGLEEDTLIVFTSDHGDHDSSHHLEHKSILYEEAARIPLIMSHKGQIPANTIDNTHPISNGLDILPTLCDYADTEVPEDLHGASIRPIAEGKSTPKWRDHIIVESQNGRMIRTARYKYCIYDTGKNPEQLTDLKNDPGEMNNLAYDKKHEKIRNQHRSLLAKWVNRTGDEIGKEYVIG